MTTDRTARLTAIREREAKASDEPWEWQTLQHDDHSRTTMLLANGHIVLSSNDRYYGSKFPSNDDKAFLSNASSDIRWLLDEVERLERLATEAEEKLEAKAVRCWCGVVGCERVSHGNYEVGGVVPLPKVLE